MVMTVVARNAGKTGGACGGDWLCLCVEGVLSQPVFYVGVFCRNLASVALNLFLHSIYFTINCILSVWFPKIMLQ